MEVPNTDERTASFNTSCLDCIFAKFSKDTQTKCKFHDRLSLYESKGLTELIEDDESGKEYYVIKTICNAKRPIGWKSRAYRLNRLIDMVEKEITIKTSYIFLCKNNIEMLDLASNMELNEEKPEKSIYVLFDWHPDIEGMRKINPKNIILVPVDKTDVRGAIDAAVDKIDSLYYTVWDSSYPTPKYIENLNKLINVELRRLLCHQPEKDCFNGLTVNKTIHTLFQGNRNLFIYDKIKEAAEYQGNTEAFHICE